MWDDVIIGNGDKGNSAYKVFAVSGNHSISENSVSYWISNAFLGMGMTIFKDTVEGRKLTRMIETKKSLNSINKWLARLCFSHAKYETILKRIEEVREESYRKGREDKSNEIKRALGIW
jgi:hypothetical protein